MKPGAFFAAALFIAGAVPASLTQAQTQTVVAPVVITGEVIRYEPGKILVVRSDGREMTYDLTPALSVPSELQVGRVVSVATERGHDGNTLVTRVTTTSVTPEGQMKSSTEETRQEPGGAITQTRLTTVTGEVVRYEPGRTIVVRTSGGQDTAFSLTPTVAVPADVQVGRKVTLHTEPGRGGATSVARVTTTTITPQGQVKRTTEVTRIKPTGESSKVTTVTVQGTVQAFVPGKSITVQRADGTKVL